MPLRSLKSTGADFVLGFRRTLGATGGKIPTRGGWDSGGNKDLGRGSKTPESTHKMTTRVPPREWRYSRCGKGRLLDSAVLNDGEDGWEEASRPSVGELGYLRLSRAG